MPYNKSFNHLRNSGALIAVLILGIGVIAAFTAQPSRQLPIASSWSRDTTCAACNDFYNYANKAWLDTASIPAARGDWGVWSANDARVLTQMHEAVEATIANDRPPSGNPLGMLYSSCMDSVLADSEGVAPLRAELAQIDSMHAPVDVIRELARLHRDGLLVVFRLASDVDRTTDLRYIATIEEGRQRLGTQGYLKTDSASVRRRAAYRDHVMHTFILAGEPRDNAALDATSVIDLETALARVSQTPQEANDETITQLFHHLSLAELKAATPRFSWDEYFRARHIATPRSLIMARPEYLTAMARIVVQHPASDWRAYLRWSVLADASPFLSSAFASESFHFAQQSSGATVQESRWQRCLREVSADVPELMGRAYVARTFPPSSKARIDTMVKQIRAVLIDRIRTVSWLTEPTRQQALVKAREFGVKIGYPDRWHDYSSLRITPGAFVAERRAALAFESARMMARIDQRPDPAEWDFHDFYHFVPQSPTAWANWNEIIFPAAYLQAPNYDSTADIASNYGAIGTIIAHEMTHLFTAFGGDIDGSGRIHTWWTPTDSARFAVLENRLIRQYSGYTVLGGTVHVNGEYTIGENLADVGGVELAFAALERQLAMRLPRERSDTTPEMRFFLAYARARVSKSRPEYLRRQVASDGHSPSQFRVNGPLADFPSFAKTFGCKPGDSMVLPDSLRTEIW